MAFTFSHRFSLANLHGFYLFLNSVLYQRSRANVQIVEKYWEGRITSSQKNTEFLRSNLNTSYLNNLTLGKDFFSSHLEDEPLSKKGAKSKCSQYSFRQFEGLTSPERIEENGSLEGRNTKEESNTRRRRDEIL